MFAGDGWKYSHSSYCYDYFVHIIGDLRANPVSALFGVLSWWTPHQCLPPTCWRQPWPPACRGWWWAPSWWRGRSRPSCFTPPLSAAGCSRHWCPQLSGWQIWEHYKRRSYCHPGFCSTLFCPSYCKQGFWGFLRYHGMFDLLSSTPCIINWLVCLEAFWLRQELHSSSSCRSLNPK